MADAEPDAFQLRPMRRTPPCGYCTRDPDAVVVTARETEPCRNCGIVYYCKDTGHACAIHDARHHAYTCRWLQTLGAIAPDLRRICELTGLFVASDGTWRCVPFSMRVPPTVRGMFLYATFIDEFPQLKRAHPAVLDGMRTTLQQRGIGFRDTSGGTYGLVHPRDAARVAQFAREHGCGRIVVPAAGSPLLPKIMWLFTTPVDRAATEYMPSDTKLSDQTWMPVERADARTPALYGPDVLAVVSWPAVPGHDDYASRMFEVMAERGVPYVLLLHERHGLSSMPETAYDTLERYYEPEPTSQFETFFVNDLSDQPAAERALTTRLHGGTQHCTLCRRRRCTGCAAMRVRRSDGVTCVFLFSLLFLFF